VKHSLRFKISRAFWGLLAAGPYRERESALVKAGPRKVVEALP
jgi:hypothetical protein